MLLIKTTEVIDNRWSEIVNKCSNFDFYHTQSYHKLEAHRPVLFSLEIEETLIALPLIIRTIEETDAFDCTSSYGYCGPISNLATAEIPQAHLDLFKKELLTYFEKNNIVTAFSRLHPLIDSERFFTSFGTIRALNKTVAIDLHLSPEEQRKQYRKSNKSELNQLRKKGYEVVVAQSEDEIDAFIAIYIETMYRVAAAPMYFFERDYFYNFLNSPDFRSKLLVAKFEGKIIAGAIFTSANGIMQYHLAGTTEAFIKVTPMKLILDEARLLGNELCLDYLHLGGGVGGSDEDPLFRFKSGFSNFYCQYEVWQLIVDQAKYDELVESKGLKNQESSFFPLYRSS